MTFTHSLVRDRVSIRTAVRSALLVLAATALSGLFDRPANAQTCPCSIWSPSAVPASFVNDSSAVELGLKFTADTNGTVTGVRFYKSAQNTGTHVGNLWSAAGALLGTVTFTNETASGWQQANFATPIAVTANTTYVVSYHTNTGNFALSAFELGWAINSPPLHTVADGPGGGNGVFFYGAASGFPSSSWNASNYWVDVVFSTGGGGGDTTLPTVAMSAPANGATVSGTTLAVSATASDNVGV